MHMKSLSLSPSGYTFMPKQRVIRKGGGPLLMHCIEVHESAYSLPPLVEQRAGVTLFSRHPQASLLRSDSLFPRTCASSGGHLPEALFKVFKLDSRGPCLWCYSWCCTFLRAMNFGHDIQETNEEEETNFFLKQITNNF